MKLNITLLKGALLTGAINACMNGTINWFSVRNLVEIPLTHDLISTKADTVFSGVVSLATSLAFILTTVSFLTSKVPNKPRYFPRVFFFALRNSFFVFGVVVAIAILVQRFAGTVMMTPLESALLSSLFAGMVGGTIDYLTKNELQG